MDKVKLAKLQFLINLFAKCAIQFNLQCKYFWKNLTSKMNHEIPINQKKKKGEEEDFLIIVVKSWLSEEKNKG